MKRGGEQHPTNVGPQESSVSIVRILVGVDVSMVGTVGSRPPECGALQSGRSTPDEEELKRKAGVVRSVRPQAMVTSHNTCTKEL